MSRIKRKRRTLGEEVEKRSRMNNYNELLGSGEKELGTEGKNNDLW